MNILLFVFCIYYGRLYFHFSQIYIYMCVCVCVCLSWSSRSLCMSIIECSTSVCTCLFFDFSPKLDVVTASINSNLTLLALHFGALVPLALHSNSIFSFLTSTSPQSGQTFRIIFTLFLRTKTKPNGIVNRGAKG